MRPDNGECKCEFLFAALAEKHNAVIRKIREIPPWEWGGEFLRLEPQVLRFLGTFSKRYPECAAFKTAYTLASALAVYRFSSREPQSAGMQPVAQPTNRRISHLRGTGVSPVQNKGRRLPLTNGLDARSPAISRPTT